MYVRKNSDIFETKISTSPNYQLSNSVLQSFLAFLTNNSTINKATMSEEQQENGSTSGEVPEIELIIKVFLAFLKNKRRLLKK